MLSINQINEENKNKKINKKKRKKKKSRNFQRQASFQKLKKERRKRKINIYSSFYCSDYIFITYTEWKARTSNSRILSNDNGVVKQCGHSESLPSVVFHFLQQNEYTRLAVSQHSRSIQEILPTNRKTPFKTIHYYIIHYSQQEAHQMC